MYLHFKKCYERFIVSGEKKTTCRIGDKSKRFYEGRDISIVVGDRYHPRIIYETVITDVKVRRWEDVWEHFIRYESPDCRTKEGLWCVMFHINKILLSPDDIVTLITWR
jgi:hypothetical protein